MPTYAWLARFGADFDNLTMEQQAPTPSSANPDLQPAIFRVLMAG